jgi:hyperosmotically inducible protein
MNTKSLWAALLGTSLMIGLAGCEKEGTLERAGEEVDEAVDTMKNGEESTGAKVDDAVDEMREGARETAEEARE